MDYVLIPILFLGSLGDIIFFDVQKLPDLQIWAVSVTYTTAHSNARSLTHWARPEMEPASSWMLVKFISAEPQREL